MLLAGRCGLGGGSSLKEAAATRLFSRRIVSHAELRSSCRISLETNSYC